MEPPRLTSAHRVGLWSEPLQELLAAYHRELLQKLAAQESLLKKMRPAATEPFHSSFGRIRWSLLVFSIHFHIFSPIPPSKPAAKRLRLGRGCRRRPSRLCRSRTGPPGWRPEPTNAPW